MAKPTLSSNGKSLIGIVKQGRGIQPLPGLMDDNMRVTIPVDHIVATADHICVDPSCGCDEPGDRCRCNTNILLSTDRWVTIQAKHADVEKLIEH